MARPQARKVAPAQLAWTAAGPRSQLYDDIYYCEDGAAEARHVFLDGNDLPNRFERASRFSIGELGFGAGVNILAAWTLWDDLAGKRPDNANLNFVSIEKHPLASHDLAAAHALICAHNAAKGLTQRAERLRAVMPPPSAGFHFLPLAPGVSLTLFYGDVADGLSRLPQESRAIIDAWFLDGFAPARNPEMWSPEHMQRLAACSKQGATAATFTVAGAVRRALLQAGFHVEKTPGFGDKREMLRARLGNQKNQLPQALPAAQRPWFRTALHPQPPAARIAIVGAGVAGASLADALKRRGFTPIVFDPNGPASGASGNPAGLIMPRLDAGDGDASAFFRQAFTHAVQRLRAIDAGGEAPIFNACGVHWRGKTMREKARIEKIADAAPLPPGWMEPADGGLFFAKAGVVDPRSFVNALLGDTPVCEASVAAVSPRENGVCIHFAKKDGRAPAAFDAVVIASAAAAKRLDALRTIPLEGVAGQIDWFPNASTMACAHAFGPYAAPAPQGGLVIGATYDRSFEGEAPNATAAATMANIRAIKAGPDALAETSRALRPEEALPRASIRCQTPDRLPIVGPLPDWAQFAVDYDGLRFGRSIAYPRGQMQSGVYALTGLGSRGLVTAPLCAEIIAAQLAGGPSPVGAEIEDALHPGRFFIRTLKKARPVKSRAFNKSAK